MESGLALRAQVWKVVLNSEKKCGKCFCNTTASVESGFECHHKCGKWFCNTRTSVESGFSTLTQVWKVVLHCEHKCGKWFCNTNTSVESGFASLAQVWKVVWIASTSVESGFALRAHVWKVVMQHQHKCGKWFCITKTRVKSGFQH